MIVSKIDEKTIELRFDPNLYSSEVLHKCFYWYAEQYSVTIQKDNQLFIVKIVSKINDPDFDLLIIKLKTDLIDFKTREIISLETKNIRDLLIAKAFANSDEFDEPPPGHVNDPLGFEPSQI
jgi:His-Xaa-Ser system protein HxsD